MSDIWEDTWEAVNGAFRSLAISLGPQHPQMSWSSGHSDNKAFPFRAYAAYNQGSADAVDVVVSVDFHRSQDRLRYSADIGLDDGSVLADGPTGVIEIPGGIGSRRPEVEAAVESILRFIKAGEAVIRGVFAARR